MPLTMGRLFLSSIDGDGSRVDRPVEFDCHRFNLLALLLSRHSRGVLQLSLPGLPSTGREFESDRSWMLLLGRGRGADDAGKIPPPTALVGHPRRNGEPFVTDERLRVIDAGHCKLGWSRELLDERLLSHPPDKSVIPFELDCD